MAYASPKQLDYAKQIATALGIDVPKGLNYDDVSRFIKENQQEFYKKKTMPKATSKQLEYAKNIADTLNINLPQSQDFETLNNFIADNRKDFYDKRYQQTRDTIKASISIVAIASELGFTPVRAGNSKYYSLKEHDSVRIDTERNCYWQNSVGKAYSNSAEGGSVIDFMKNFTNRSMSEIIKDLSERVTTGRYEVSVNDQAKTQSKEERGKLELPNSASNMRRVYAYLTKTRLIDSEIVQEFVDRKMLYQDERGNCVFVSKDQENKPIFACKRGTNTERRFVGDVENCDYSKGFYIDNNADKLVVAESVIDAMSIMNIIKAKGEDIHNYNYLPLAGATKFECLINQLKDHPVNDLYMALDNDKAGIKNLELARELIGEQLGDVDMSIHECIPKFTKDWNEEIIHAFKKQIDYSHLDFFNEQIMDAAAEKMQNRLEKKESDLIISTAVPTYEVDEEIEL